MRAIGDPFIEQATMHGTRTQDLFQKRQLRSSGPEWHYTPLERNGPEVGNDGTDNPFYKERLEAPAGLGSQIPQAAGRIRPASAASSRGARPLRNPEVDAFSVCQVNQRQNDRGLRQRGSFGTRKQKRR